MENQIEYFRYELIDTVKNHRKFWEIAVVDNCCLVRYGRIACKNPRQEVFDRGDKYEAVHYADKKKNTKIKKGYKYRGKVKRKCFVPGLKYADIQPDLNPNAGASGKIIKQRNLEIDW